MPKNILDYIEKEQEYPPRISISTPKKDSKTVSLIKWGIYISITLVFITFLYFDAPSHRKIDTLLGLGIAFYIAFPLLAVFILNFFLNCLVFCIHWLIISQIKDVRIHNIYSKIYFTTPTSLIIILLLMILAVWA